MKYNGKISILAVIMGILLPSLLLNLSSKRSWQPETEPPLSTESQSSESLTIPVLMGDTQVFMDLEAYLVGVVLAEMGGSFETEALKAQAVAARTYTMRRVWEGVRHAPGGVCTDYNCCQAYISVEDYLQSRGDQQDVDKVTDAVLQTEGLVVTYRGKLAETTYFSCSGGRTEDAAAVWGSDIPYLQAVDSPGEEGAAGYSKTVHFSSAAFADALGRELTGTPAEWLGEVTYSQGGGVATMVIGGKSYTGVQLRKLLKLNSTAFTMEAKGEEIHITTRGHGHRVGMSQYGADAMAVTGSSYREILAHYYPGTAIDKLEAIR